jgi:hypothetical protein
MVSYGMLRRVALVRTYVSEELSASLVRVFLCSVCGLLVAASFVPSSPILVTLMKESLSSSETSVLTRATRRNIPEDTIIHSHRRENLKLYGINPQYSQRRKGNGALSSGSIASRPLRLIFSSSVASSRTSIIKYVRCNRRILCARVALVIWEGFMM